MRVEIVATDLAVRHQEFALVGTASEIADMLGLAQMGCDHAWSQDREAFDQCLKLVAELTALQSLVAGLEEDTFLKGED